MRYCNSIYWQIEQLTLNPLVPGLNSWCVTVYFIFGYGVFERKKITMQKNITIWFQSILSKKIND
jgi:hypothetical protein